MGIFQRYVKKDKDGKPILGKNGKPKREGPWFIQHPYARDPESGKIKYRTEKASFSKKKAEKMFRSKVDAFQDLDKLGIQIDNEMENIKMALKSSLGNAAKAARNLGVSPQLLHYKMKKYKINRHDYKS